MCTTCKPACETQAPARTINPHAALMREYTEEVIFNPDAYKNWEYKINSDPDWRSCVGHPGWDRERQYRRKVKTIRIGTMEVPEPLRVAPPKGTMCWTAGPGAPRFYYPIFEWRDDDIDIRCLARGIVHTSKEAAAQHGKALAAISGGTY